VDGSGALMRRYGAGRAELDVTLFATRRGFWPSVVGLSALMVACIPWTLQGAGMNGLMVAACCAGGLARVFARREVEIDGTLEVTKHAVFCNGERLCEIGEIEAALLTPRGRPRQAGWMRRGGVLRGRQKQVVVLMRRGRAPVRIGVDDTRQGRAVIRAIGLDPRETIETFSLPTMYRRARAGAFAAAAAIGLCGVVAIPLLGSALPAVAIALAVLAYLAFVVLARTKLLVGGDGVRVECLGRTRFIGHDEVESVAAHRGGWAGVEVTLRSGEVVRIPTATHVEGDGRLAAGIVDLLETARGGSSADAATEESLSRGGRAAAEWLRTMRSLALGANADHRTAPIDPGRVWQVLRDPAAEASARVGAAALLATVATEEERGHLRVAAKAIAAPRVRVAIEALAGGEEEAAVLEALEAIEGERKRKPAARRGDDKD
jgi:hypothetical protein